jgi:hypothetical protein
VEIKKSHEFWKVNKQIFGGEMKTRLLKTNYVIFIGVILLSAVIFFVLYKVSRKDQFKDTIFTKKSLNVDVKGIERAVRFEDLFDVVDTIELKGKIIGSIYSFFKLPNENLIVVDRIGKEICVFSPDGMFLRNVGGKGDGPGEFINPVDVKFNQWDGLIYVMDINLRRISAFDTLGRFRFSFRVEKVGEQMVLYRDRIYLFGAGYLRENMVSCFDTKGKLLFTFCEPSDFIKSIKIPITGKAGGIVIFDDKIFLVHPYEYILRVFNLDGKNVGNIRVNSKLYKSPRLEPNSMMIDISSFTPILSPLLNLQDLFFIIVQVPDGGKAKNYLELFYLPDNKLLSSIELSEKYPLYIDGANYIYFSYQPHPAVGKDTLPNPVIYKCRLRFIK